MDGAPTERTSELCRPTKHDEQCYFGGRGSRGVEGRLRSEIASREYPFARQQKLEMGVKLIASSAIYTASPRNHNSSSDRETNHTPLNERAPPPYHHHHSNHSRVVLPCESWVGRRRARGYRGALSQTVFNCCWPGLYSEESTRLLPFSGTHTTTEIRSP